MNFARILTDHENSARSRIGTDSVREIDGVRSRVGSLCLFVDELGRDVSCVEFDSIACEHFFAVDGPAWPWFRIRREWYGYRERFTGDHRHVANTEIRRDPRRDWKKICANDKCIREVYIDRAFRFESKNEKYSHGGALALITSELELHGPRPAAFSAATRNS